MGRDWKMMQVGVSEVLPYCAGVSSILDVGCKSGAMVAELVHLGLDAYGVDIGDRCEQYWNENNAGIIDRLFKADVTTWKSDRKFDLMILSHVIEHFYDPDKTMINLRSMLSDGGRMVLWFPIGDNYGAHYFTFDDESEIEPYFSALGFVTVEFQKISSGEYPVYKLVLK